MRTDIKIGMAVVLLLALGVVVYFAATQIGPKDDPNEAVDRPGEDRETYVLDGERSGGPASGADEPALGAAEPNDADSMLGFLDPDADGGSVSDEPNRAVVDGGAEAGTSDTDAALIAFGEGDGVVVDAGPSAGGTEATLIPVGADEQIAMDVDAGGGLTPGQPGGSVYIVQEGDLGFWGIAEKVYGDGKHYALIAKANPTVHSSSLRVGQALQVPPLPKPGERRPAAATDGVDGGAPAARKDRYTVQKGDAGFWGIAQKVYGNGAKWPLIAKANPDVDSRSLRPGMVLTVPPLTQEPTRETVDGGLSGATATGQKTYTVQKGDAGFWGIAEKVYGHGKHHAKIAEANPSANPTALRPGQVLVIPRTRWSRPAARSRPRRPVWMTSRS